MKLIRTFALLCSAVALLAAAPAIHAADASAKKDAKPALIDINTATAEQLQTLDGIGDARAAAIIKGRPYTNKAQIVSKAGVPQATYDAIKDKIIAKQPGDDKAKADKKDSGSKKGGDKKKKKPAGESSGE